MNKVADQTAEGGSFCTDALRLGYHLTVDGLTSAKFDAIVAVEVLQRLFANFTASGTLEQLRALG